MKNLWMVVAVALLIASSVAYVRHLAVAAEEAHARQVEAESSLSMCGSALDAATTATDAAKARAELMQRQAQAIIDGTKPVKAANAAAGALFAGKVDEAKGKAECQSVLEATLCPALSGY